MKVDPQRNYSGETLAERERPNKHEPTKCLPSGVITDGFCSKNGECGGNFPGAALLTGVIGNSNVQPHG
jgi:hypothetical protein